MPANDFLQNVEGYIPESSSVREPLILPTFRLLDEPIYKPGQGSSSSLQTEENRQPRRDPSSLTTLQTEESRESRQTEESREPERDSSPIPE